jgi:hypothetical protein
MNQPAVCCTGGMTTEQQWQYLERAPVDGDRVHVEYEAEWHATLGGLALVAVADGGGRFIAAVPSDAVIRVIAPEFKVGGVVTADMDLPTGSIVTTQDTIVAVRDNDRWWMSSTGRQGLYWHPAEDGVRRGRKWRIVRIGDGS